jgi:Ig-like domain from next to BRCA1 gene
MKHFGYFLLITTIFALSCDVSTLLSPGAIPSPDQNLVQTIIVQTGGAAASQTAAVVTPSLTPSSTPLPSQTPSITPSPTETFVFNLPTPKIKATGTNVQGATGSKNGAWDCQLVSQSPPNGASIAANYPFSANWTVQNTGYVVWLQSSVDLIHTGGPQLSSASGYNTHSDVAVGSSETLSIQMTAPASSGSYTSIWSLRASRTIFCPLTVTIMVP